MVAPCVTVGSRSRMLIEGLLVGEAVPSRHAWRVGGLDESPTLVVEERWLALD